MLDLPAFVECVLGGMTLSLCVYVLFYQIGFVKRMTNKMLDLSD